jgi:hypothetical protein
VTLDDDERGGSFDDRFADAFDPTGDRLLFGFASRSDDEWGDPEGDDFWVSHPLGAGATADYRFSSGDTLTLTFPDGRSLSVTELRVVPRSQDVHRIMGSLWIEPETGALVRAVYRLSDVFDAFRDLPDFEEEAEDGLKWVPGLLKPFTFELGIISVDYALWDFEIWLPRAMRMEGTATAGILKFPTTFDMSYRIESVVTENDLAAEEAGRNPVGVTEERHFETRAEAMAYLAQLASEGGTRYAASGASSGRRSRYIGPEDPSVLLDSPDLPPPVWEDAPGFTSEAELRTMFEGLADLDLPGPTRTAWAANWGLQRPDLIRYNRVEGPALGARLQARFGSPVGPLSGTLEPFLGIADLEPKARASLTRESLRHRLELGAYRTLATVERDGGHLEIGNSAMALLFGRDDGEYFMATGADFTWSPPSASMESFRVRLYGERHEAVRKETDFTLAHAFDGAWVFRDNVAALEQDEVGLEVLFRPWRGTDPLAPQVGMELYGQVADGSETGDFSRASLMLAGVIPFQVRGGHYRIALEGEGGRSWGSVPIQREWYLGSTGTLRGYPASIRHGRAFTRARAEVARGLPAASVALFSDAGWVGERPSGFHFDDVLYSVGVGASVLDGLIRLDVSRGLRAPRGTRVDFYLDAAF